MIRLVSVDRHNVDAVCALDVSPTQRAFVAPNATSLAQAYAHPEAWPRAAYRDQDLVGFVMLEVPPGGPHDELFVWRLMVGAEHQGQGLGRAILGAAHDEMRARGALRSLTSVVPGEGGPLGFYQRVGYRPTGEISDGEVVLALELGPQSAPDPTPPTRR